MSLAGLTVAVTGATGGIGAAVVRQLAASGANVVITDLTAGPVASLADELGSAGQSVLGAAVDTTDESAVDSVLDDAMARFGAIHGIVTAAGVDHVPTPALDVDLSVWDRVLRVNVVGTFVAARAAARRMVGGGAIVTVGSVSATTARMGKVPYCASKAAVVSMTRALALELASRDIRVNAVCPGPTDTPMVSAAVAESGQEVLERRIRGSLEHFRTGIPLGRIGTPDEQASVIRFLLSSDASFMTGAVVHADGGVTVV